MDHTEYPPQKEANTTRQFFATHGMSLSSILCHLRGLSKDDPTSSGTYIADKTQQKEMTIVLRALSKHHRTNFLKAVRAIGCGSDRTIPTREQSSPRCRENVETLAKTRQSVPWLTNAAQRKRIETFVRQRLHLLRNQHMKCSTDVLDLVHTSTVTHIQQLLLSLVQLSMCRRNMTTGRRKLDSPRSFVRASNTTLEDDNNLRVQEERKAIMLAGEHLARHGQLIPEEDEQLKEKLTQLLQEEEERATASATNEAVRSAFGGEAKYLRWSQKSQQVVDKTSTSTVSVEANKADNEFSQDKRDKLVLTSVSVIDFYMLISDGAFRHKRTRRQQFYTQTKICS